MIALLLADGRFPSGGYAHSGGIEAAVQAGRVRDIESLAAFLIGRLFTSGLTAAGISAAGCTGMHDWTVLQRETDARTPSPLLRKASCLQGRQLVRAASGIWEASLFQPVMEATAGRPHHPVALGAVAAKLGVMPLEAARIAALGAVVNSATAAVKLLGLDPLAAHRVVAELSEAVERCAAEAASYALGPPANLPSCASPLLEILSVQHAAQPVRLFAS